MPISLADVHRLTSTTACAWPLHEPLGEIDGPAPTSNHRQSGLAGVPLTDCFCANQRETAFGFQCVEHPPEKQCAQVGGAEVSAKATVR